MPKPIPRRFHRLSAFFKLMPNFFKLFTAEGNAAGRKEYANHFLLRQKYIAKQVSNHVGVDKDEPAPLLGLTVLDIGCGSRSLGEALVLRGAEVTAIDVDEERLASAQESAEKFGTNINFMKSTPETLVQEVEMFDVVLCMNVFKYADDLNRVVWATRRLTKKDGIAIFSACNNSLISWFWHIFMAEKILKWRPKGTYNTKRFVSIKELDKSLAANGMERTHAVGLNFNYVESTWEKCGNNCTRWLASAKFKRQL